MPTVITVGIQGPAGPRGATGTGVPAGGISNQFLVKNSSTNFDSIWKSITTDQIPEGETNVYFTAGRAISALTGQALSLFANDEGYISNVTGLIAQGSNITITGTGTDDDPYIINSSGGGVSIGGAVTGSSPYGVLYTDTSNNLAQDSTNFIYDPDNLGFNVGFSGFSGLNISFIFGSFQLGDINSSNNKCYISVNDSSNNISAYLNGHTAFSLNNNGIFIFGDNQGTLGGSVLFLDTTSAIINIASASYLFLNASSDSYALGNTSSTNSYLQIIGATTNSAQISVNNNPIMQLILGTSYILGDLNGVADNNRIVLNGTAMQIVLNGQAMIAADQSSNEVTFGGIGNFLRIIGSSQSALMFLGSNEVLNFNASSGQYQFGANGFGNSTFSVINDALQYFNLLTAGADLFRLDPLGNISGNPSYSLGDVNNQFDGNYLRLSNVTGVKEATINLSDITVFDSTVVSGNILTTIGAAFAGNKTSIWIDDTSQSIEFKLNSISLLSIDPTGTLTGTPSYSLGDTANAIDGNSFSLFQSGGNGSASLLLNNNNVIVALMNSGHPVILMGSPFNGNNTYIGVDDLNQLITITNIPAYLNDADASGAGLITGQLYKTTTLGVTALNIVP